MGKGGMLAQGGRVRQEKKKREIKLGLHGETHSRYTGRPLAFPGPDALVSLEGALQFRESKLASVQGSSCLCSDSSDMLNWHGGLNASLATK